MKTGSRRAVVAIAVGLAAALGGALLAVATDWQPSGSFEHGVATRPSETAGDSLSQAAERGTRPAPPRFRNTAPELQLLPGHEGYDPFKLKDLVPLKDIHAQEPRNEPWAKPVEAFLAVELEQNLRPLLGDFQLTGIECRTTTCKITWNGSEENTRLLQKRLALLLPGSAGYYENKPERYVSFLGGPQYGDSPRNDPAKTIVQFRKVRAALAAQYDRGRLRGVDGPKMDLPESARREQ
jgi:hypothetical protein